jgi:hypothetical protein
MAVLSSSTEAAFKRAGSFARKRLTLGEPESDVALAQIQSAISALEAERDVNPTLVEQYISELNGYVSEIEGADTMEAAEKQEAAKTTPEVSIEKNNTTVETNADGSSSVSTPSGTTYVTPDGERSSNPAEEDATNGGDKPRDYSDNAASVPDPEFGDLEGAQRAAAERAEEDTVYYENDGTSSTKKDTPAGRVTAETVSSKSGGGVKAEWKEAKDLRAILRVPKSYLTGFTDPAGVLKGFGGIVFPYTPTIAFDQQASYNPINPLHSNYTQYFYKNSAVSAITVTGKFTVQNESDGLILLGVIHLLRALTKMRFGPDKDSGAPPPVCRLEAYGDFMLRNVPVVVASFRHDLPEGVDYIAVGKKSTTFGHNIVPALSTISLTLNPMWSRQEMQDAGVGDWLAGKNRGEGYL